VAAVLGAHREGVLRSAIVTELAVGSGVLPFHLHRAFADPHLHRV
jgi:hypothetical protein